MCVISTKNHLLFIFSILSFNNIEIFLYSYPEYYSIHVVYLDILKLSYF